MAGTRVDALNNSPFRNVVTVTLAAAGDYAANDVLSNDADAGEGDPIEFANFVPVAGMVGTIFAGTFAASVEILPRIRLHFFNSTPNASTEMDDNAAFAIVDADQANYLGFMDFETAADVGGISFGRSQGVLIPFYCAGTTLYAIAQTLDAFTNESAGMTITFQLFGYLD